jgi:hypothetical protein
MQIQTFKFCMPTPLGISSLYKKYLAFYYDLYYYLLINLVLTVLNSN